MLNNLKNYFLNKSNSYNYYKHNVSKLDKEINDLIIQNKKLKEENKIYTSNIKYPPGHFYSPLPNIEDIKNHKEESFSRNKKLYGININKEEQLKYLKLISNYYKDFIYKKNNIEGYRYQIENPNFGFYAAVALFGMLRNIKPKKLIEVGSGWSSCLTLDTNEKFFNNEIDLTFIEPYPNLLYDIIKEEDKNHINVVDSKIQDIDVNFFKELGENDILFIDSTHVSKMDSDTNYLIHTILPNLNKGVIIHFHDVLYPFEYPESWILEGRGWNEAYILRAFLEFNDTFEIIFMNNYIKEQCSDELKNLLPDCVDDLSSSLWLRKIK